MVFSGVILIRFSSLPYLCVIALLVAGCGAHVTATVKPTARSHATAAPTTIAEGATPLPAQSTETPQALPSTAASIAPSVTVLPATATPTSAPQPGRVLSATLRPISVPAGAALTASVQTAGTVGRVEMYLGSGSPTAPPPIAFSLSPRQPGVWTGSGTAPNAVGEYHFTVGIYVNGRRTMADRDGWNIQVTGASNPVSLSLPPDIPLAPPFSYGNPVPAVFSALGESVDGAEVVSTTRQDVAPATVAQWYTVHLPRAGWSVDPSTVPAAGATSFDMVGSMAGASGTRVCIVQYGSYTVRIFYGTASR